MKERKRIYKSYRDIAEKMHVSEWYIWSLMDKIRFRFERNKALRFFFQGKDMDAEDVIFKITEH